MVKSKSLFRQPGAQHFQLVHRSLRDPLIHDSEASKHVLKQVIRENDKKGKSRAELEDILDPEHLRQDGDSHLGEAALYGVYYDDAEYNYMQHLKPVGMQEDGVDSILIEAPSRKKPQVQKAIDLRDLPQEALPSTSELPRTYESQQAIPESISGFQPDMDPHLRQVLEALEDDAFVEDELEDDFFDALVKDGERGDNETVSFAFEEDGYATEDEERLDDPDASWEARFAQFRKQKEGQSDEEEEDFQSETGDTVSDLPAMSVIGGKRRRKGSSDATGYSMSSSSMFRTATLQTLDEQFDQVMLKEYRSENEEQAVSDDDEEVPTLITSREDFDSLVDEFLDDFELLGRKLKPKLQGETGIDKLDTLRKGLGQDERVRFDNSDDGHDSDEELDELLGLNREDKRDRWDCETIITTYSNLENHPRIIRAREAKPVARIQLDPKTGLPNVAGLVDGPRERKSRARPTLPESGTESDGEPQQRETITRPRGESGEVKKARKAAVKAAKAVRRVEKKSNREVFGNEAKNRTKIELSKGVEMKKL